MVDVTQAVIKDGKVVAHAGAADRIVDSQGNPMSGGLKATTRARVATQSNIADLLTGAPLVEDGITLQDGNIVLSNNQTDASENGLYTVVTAGTGSDGVWARAEDYDEDLEINSLILVQVTDGDKDGDTIWALDSIGGLTVGTSSLNFVKQSRERGRLSRSDVYYLDGRNQLASARVLEFVADKPGYIVASSVVSEEARTAGTIDFQVKVNGSNVASAALNLQINNTNVRSASANSPFGEAAFAVAQGDLVSVEATSATFEPLINCGRVELILESQF